MAIEYRDERKRWGFRVCLQGRTYKRYAWQTKAEAKQAEADFLANLKQNPPLPANAFIAVVGAYLVESAELGRSQWRLDALRRNFDKFIIPFFGDTTLITAVTSSQVEDFIKAQKKRGVQNITIWHYVKDLRACFYWALRKGLVRKNPVVGADLKSIRNRAAKKPPLDPVAFDRAADAIANPSDRAWFDVTRFTGMRKDEANRLTWGDINFDLGMIRYPGTKTDESNTWLPMAPVAIETLRRLKAVSDPNNPLVFPGRSAQTKGKKIYSRRRMFERIRKETGIHVRPKDLRDYFASEIAARVNDPAVVMKLLRHTSLTTTTKYLRTVNDRLEAAVQTLGATLGGRLDAETLQKTTQHDEAAKNLSDRKSLISRRDDEGKYGGRSRNRTYDLAHVRRAL